MSELNSKSSSSALAQTISNPRRILAISHESSVDLLTALITDLTGSPPLKTGSEDVNSSLAGTTHHLSLKTKYYTASVPIWLDLINDDQKGEWASSFLSDDAQEVLDVLGGVILIFPVTKVNEGRRHQEVIEQVGRVVKEGLGGWEWGGVSIAVGVGGDDAEDDDDGVVDEWDDLCAGLGMEFVHWEGKTEKGKRNEFGERVGIERVREALESNDWDFGVGPGSDDDEGEEEGEDEFDLGVGVGKAEDMEALKRAIFGRDEEGEGSNEEGGEDGLNDEDIKSLERMMQKLQAVRDMSAGLPEGERKRMAKKAVEEVMKEL
ncbi:hypothetical protein QBC38DRAFT_534391 [Podospora fimiseda]|uniref:Increased recombination centers protein 6 n=1 Tax=Podospora fimiseda TaxID=252190 RepID=A0AAN7BVM5_9PEZI|nr:hypothetical protein QBC38DRAFT_534391 [Podospora fimiseda]